MPEVRRAHKYDWHRHVSQKPLKRQYFRASDILVNVISIQSRIKYNHKLRQIAGSHQIFSDVFTDRKGDTLIRMNWDFGLKRFVVQNFVMRLKCKFSSIRNNFGVASSIFELTTTKYPGEVARFTFSAVPEHSSSMFSFKSACIPMATSWNNDLSCFRNLHELTVRLMFAKEQNHGLSFSSVFLGHSLTGRLKLGLKTRSINVFAGCLNVLLPTPHPRCGGDIEKLFEDRYVYLPQDLLGTVTSRIKN